MADLDELCPPDVGAEAIRLSLPPDLVVTAGTVIDVFLDASNATGGLVLPLDVILTPPDASKRSLRIMRRFIPRTISIRIEDAGPHVLIVRERYHQRFFGRLRFTAIEG